MLGSLLMAWLARVEWTEGDGVILDYQGERYDLCMHCYPEGRPLVGAWVRFPSECPEIRRIEPWESDLTIP